MKTEYKKYSTVLFYSYNPETNTTIRVSDKSEPNYFHVFNFRFDDWDSELYERMSKAQFNKLLNATLKKIKEIAK